jgi:hypothetical protein
MARPLALPRPPEAVSAAVERFWPLVVLALAGIALIVAEFLTLREIVAVTVVPEGGRTTGGAHHGYAIGLVGLVSLPMSYGAVLGGSRPAAAALAVLGALGLAIAAIFDLPSLNETGLIGRTYDLAEANPGADFWLEIACAAVLLIGGLLLVRSHTTAAREASAARRDQRRARRAADTEAPPLDDDAEPDNDDPEPQDEDPEPQVEYPAPAADAAPGTGSRAAGSRRRAGSRPTRRD